jgi:hypothetical protein
MWRGDLMIDEKLRALPRDAPNYHERQAAHLRALAQSATTPRLKTRLLQQAKEHEQKADGREISEER